MHNNQFLAQFKGWLKKHGVPEYYSCADKKGFLRDHIMGLSLEEFATEFGYLCVRKKPGPKLTAMKKTKTSEKPRTPVEPDNTDPPAHPGCPQSHNECAQCGRPHYLPPHASPYPPPHATPYPPHASPHPSPYAPPYTPYYPPQHAPPYALHYPPQHAPPYAPPFASHYLPQHAPYALHYPQHTPPQHAPPQHAPPQHDAPQHDAPPQHAPPQHAPTHVQFAPQYPPRPESLNAANLEQPDENYDAESSDSNTSAELPAMWFHDRRAKTAAASRICAQSLS